MARVYVSGLKPDLRPKEFERVMREHAPGVQEVTLLMDDQGERNTGTGFVTYVSQEAARCAVASPLQIGAGQKCTLKLSLPAYPSGAAPSGGGGPGPVRPPAYRKSKIHIGQVQRPDGDSDDQFDDDPHDDAAKRRPPPPKRRRAAPPPQPHDAPVLDTSSVEISGFAESTTEEALRELVGIHGTLTDLTIHRLVRPVQAIAVMDNPTAATTLVSHLDGMLWRGSTLAARPHAEAQVQGPQRETKSEDLVDVVLNPSRNGNTAITIGQLLLMLGPVADTPEKKPGIFVDPNGHVVIPASAFVADEEDDDDDDAEDDAK